MNNLEKGYLLFQKDFSEKSTDRYFIYALDYFSEVDVAAVVDFNGVLITHDYWLIAPSIYAAARRLPTRVVDVVDVIKMISGKRVNSEGMHNLNASDLLKSRFTDIKDLEAYFSSFYRRTPVNFENYQLFSHNLANYWSELESEIKRKNEWLRFIDVEFPLFNMMAGIAVKGIRVDLDVLRAHKAAIHTDFFHELRSFAVDFDLSFEVPKDADLKEIFSSRGHDMSENSVDFILEFVPTKDNLGDRTVKLRKIANSRAALATIPISGRRICPIVETHSTVTSRIYYKSPTLQNLARKYRDICIADEGYELSYIDYDQFEVGIMAALSKDKKLLEIYSNDDVYKVFAATIFGRESERNLAKKIFLSFTYGMSLDRVFMVISANGGDRDKARVFFDEFHVFSTWRENIAAKFQRDGRIGTILGNYLERTEVGELTQKERRSCVSQVVQGTGSLIFKNALLELGKDQRVNVLVPMHDAVLVQHLPAYDRQNLVSVFEAAMNSVLENNVKSKASIQAFN